MKLPFVMCTLAGIGMTYAAGELWDGWGAVFGLCVWQAVLWAPDTQLRRN